MCNNVVINKNVIINEGCNGKGKEKGRERKKQGGGVNYGKSPGKWSLTTSSEELIDVINT